MDWQRFMHNRRYLILLVILLVISLVAPPDLNYDLKDIPTLAVDHVQPIGEREVDQNLFNYEFRVTMIISTPVPLKFSVDPMHPPLTIQASLNYTRLQAVSLSIAPSETHMDGAISLLNTFIETNTEPTVISVDPGTSFFVNITASVLYNYRVGALPPIGVYDFIPRSPEIIPLGGQLLAYQSNIRLLPYQVEVGTFDNGYRVSQPELEPISSSVFSIANISYLLSGLMILITIIRFTRSDPSITSEQSSTDEHLFPRMDY